MCGIFVFYSPKRQYSPQIPPPPHSLPFPAFLLRLLIRYRSRRFSAGSSKPFSALLRRVFKADLGASPPGPQSRSRRFSAGLLSAEFGAASPSASLPSPKARAKTAQ